MHIHPQSQIAGVDYTAVNQPLTFPAGARAGNSLGRQCFFVATIEDSGPEPDETLQLGLMSSNTAVLLVQAGRGTATVTITDDDGMGHCLSVSTITTNTFSEVISVTMQQQFNPFANKLIHRLHLEFKIQRLNYQHSPCNCKARSPEHVVPNIPSTYCHAYQKYLLFWTYNYDLNGVGIREIPLCTR